MKKYYAFIFLIFISFAVIITSCSDSDDDYVPVASVKVDLTQVPYPKLSDYKFFVGEMKNQIPAEGVLPFSPASILFSDYAKKKRFVWMPAGKKATYNSDKTILELPVGAALIKTFYYDNVQNIPEVGATKIIETRVMIRKSTGWIFADYIWNEAQTEAVYDMRGSFSPVTWKDENDVVKTANYRIPSDAQCAACHKFKMMVDDHEVTTYIPIGIKPQNLNYVYNYGSETKNQLTKWIEKGYLENNFTLPSQENTTVNYDDESKPLSLRVRSYVDANCSHCHQDHRHCDYRPMRFAFYETGGTDGLTKMGVCVDTQDMQGFSSDLSKIVTPRNIEHSMLYFRVNTTSESIRMPLHGRSLVHQEGVALIRDWINSLRECN